VQHLAAVNELMDTLNVALEFAEQWAVRANETGRRQ
jgi:hypothetical protein